MATGPVPEAAGEEASRDKHPIILSPSGRRTPDDPPAPPPDLPPGADRVTPLTVEALVELQRPRAEKRTIRQAFTRTVDRVHLQSNNREWLFVRNPKDARSATGYCIEHASRTVIVFEDSDLRNVLGIRGWADIVMFGFDRSLLGELKRTDESRNLNGIHFVRYTNARKDARKREVWWSDDQAFPSAFVIADAGGTTRFSIKRVRAGATAELLQLPSSRFPKYRLIDFPDWLENH
jgi:hypothetical protein